MVLKWDVYACSKQWIVVPKLEAQSIFSLCFWLDLVHVLGKNWQEWGNDRCKHWVLRGSISNFFSFFFPSKMVVEYLFLSKVLVRVEEGILMWVYLPRELKPPKHVLWGLLIAIWLFLISVLMLTSSLHCKLLMWVGYFIMYSMFGIEYSVGLDCLKHQNTLFYSVVYWIHCKLLMRVFHN